MVRDTVPRFSLKIKNENLDDRYVLHCITGYGDSPQLRVREITPATERPAKHVVFCTYCGLRFVIPPPIRTVGELIGWAESRELVIKRD